MERENERISVSPFKLSSPFRPVHPSWKSTLVQSFLNPSDQQVRRTSTTCESCASSPTPRTLFGTTADSTQGAHKGAASATHTAQNPKVRADWTRNTQRYRPLAPGMFRRRRKDLQMSGKRNAAESVFRPMYPFLAAERT